MWFTHRAWIPVAWILSLINVGAVWFAAQPGEPWHATVHALLAVLSAVAAERLMIRRRPRADEAHFDQLQRSVDVIALEVERISEGQRYVTKILSDNLRPSIGSGEAERIAAQRKDSSPVRSDDAL